MQKKDVKMDVRKDGLVVQNGVVCFTFDDSMYHDWLVQQDLFKKYNAHATFFFSGAISDEVLSSMRKLQANGHSIGLHSLNHVDASAFCEKNGCAAYLQQQVLPQLEKCQKAGISIRNFAYPDNSRNEETDQLLRAYFQRLRAGLGLTLPTGYCIAEQKLAFHSLDTLPKTLVMRGNGIGDYYATTTDNLDKALECASLENKLLVFFSHGISPDAQGVHMKTAQLEHCLKTASDLGLVVAGFDDLSAIKTR